MLRYVLNLAFLTTATNIQKHPLLLCYCLDFLCPHCPPPIRHSCHVDDSYNLNKQKKGKWKQEGKETSAYSLARLAPLPFAFSDWIKLVTKGVCREKRSAGKVEAHWSLRSPDTAPYKNKQTPLMLKCIIIQKLQPKINCFAAVFWHCVSCQDWNNYVLKGCKILKIQC